MSLRIYTVHHIDSQQSVLNSIVQPFLIQNNDPRYSEMRASYIIWKQINDSFPDYIGFQHYRRYFYFEELMPIEQTPPISNGRSLFDRYLNSFQEASPETLEKITQCLSKYDIITPKSIQTYPSLSEQYRRSHKAEHWEILINLMSKHFFFSRELNTELKEAPLFNMFIMKIKEFQDYMEIWSNIVFQMESMISLPTSGYQSRVFGFLSERFFAMYVNNLRSTKQILELPLITNT